MTDTKLILSRCCPSTEFTAGKISIGGEFECHTLERGCAKTTRGKQPYIPKGTYRITARQSGGMHKRYSHRFSKNHQGMLWLRDVNDYRWIYIHVGNSVDDTTGCILVGDRYRTRNGRFELANSVRTYRELYRQVIGAAIAEELCIEIINY